MDKVVLRRYKTVLLKDDKLRDAPSVVFVHYFAARANNTKKQECKTYFLITVHFSTEFYSY
jgi:hypothetical protein